MSLQSPLGRFLGHGSAKEGTEHWWGQKLTAVALVPLTLWFAVAMLGLETSDFAVVQAWIASPVNGIPLVLLLAAGLYHSMLGVEVIVEDYVHGALKVVTLIIFKLAHWALAVAGIYSVIVISVGAA